MFFYQISTLTTEKDEWTGGAQNDMFTASLGGPLGNAHTLTAGDILDGGDGDDTLILDAQGTVVTGLQTVKNIENLKVYESAGWTGNVSEFAGLKNVEVTANGAVTLTAGVSVTDVTVLNTGGAAGTAATTLTGDGIATVTARNLASAGDTTLTVNNTTAKHALNVTLDKVGTVDAAGAAANELTIKDATAETIALTSNGLLNVAKISTGATDTVLKTVTIAGKGDLVLNLASTQNTAVTTIDGAKAEGDLTLTGIATATKTITTGAGDDKVTLAAGAVLLAGSTVSLGAGDDTLTMKFASLTTNLKLDGGANTAEGDALIFSDAADFTAATAKYALVKDHGFEVVGVSGDVALKADAGKLGVHSFYLEGGETASTTSAATITNGAIGDTITFADNTAITGGGVYGASKLDMSAGIVNGVVNVNLEAGKGATAGFDVVTVADFHSAGSNTFNVTSTSLGEVNANTIKITGAANSTVNILGDHTVEVTNGNTGVNEKTVFNAENFGASMKFTGDAGIDIVTASAFGDTITGGAGEDKITLGAGVDTVVLGTFAIAKVDTVTKFDNGADILSFAGSSAKVAAKSAGDFADMVTYDTLAKVLATFATGGGSNAGELGASKAVSFTYDGAVYAVIGDSSAGYNDGDAVVKLAGITLESTGIDLNGAAANS